jgi:hypothetical protein
MVKVKNDIREFWKPIPGWDEIYWASNLGRIKSVYIRKRGVVHKIRKLCLHKATGYLQVRLQKGGLNKRNCNVHILIAATFKKNKRNLPEVNHKNAIKTDNRSVNLEYTTRKGNIQHAIKMGLIVRKKGVEHFFSRSVAKYLNNRLIKEYPTITDAVKDGYSFSGIRMAIKDGYKHKGFRWMYTSESKWKRSSTLNKRRICRISSSGRKKTYPSIDEVVIDGFDRGNVYKALKRDTTTVKGYYWRYVQ